MMNGEPVWPNCCPFCGTHVNRGGAGSRHTLLHCSNCFADYAVEFVGAYPGTEGDTFERKYCAYFESQPNGIAALRSVLEAGRESLSRPHILPMHTAIVLIAHGSRRPEANAELLQLAEKVREARSGCLVASAFLELAEPSIPVAVRDCIAQGARRVLLFPYFLSSGVHVTRDLEEFRRQFADEHPDVQFQLAQPLGAHPLIPSLVLDLLPANALATGDALPRGTPQSE